MLILGAVLASWLGPIVVARYQLTAESHRQAANLLDSIIEQTAPLEAAVQVYSDAQDSYWRYEANLQARRIVARVLLGSSPNVAELQRQEEMFTKEESEAKAELQRTRAKYDQETEEFKRWSIATELKLQHLFPSSSAAIAANFERANRRLLNAQIAIANRDLGFRVLSSVRDRKITESAELLRGQKATAREIDQFISEAAVLTMDKHSAHLLQFKSLCHLADMLRGERPLLDDVALTGDNTR
jgi:hypothetical protein